MERSADSPVSRGSSSAAAGGRPRGQRTVVVSASTSVRPGSVHARRHQSRLRRTVLVATNDCDAGVPHVAHTRRGCLVTADCRRRTTSRMTAGSRKWSRLLITGLQSARHIHQNIRHDVCSFKLRLIHAVFVTPELNQRRAHVCQLDRHAQNRCRKHRGNLRQRRVHTCSCRCNVARTGTEITKQQTGHLDVGRETRHNMIHS